MCLECSSAVNKYKCPRCALFCCSFDCFKRHQDANCTPEKTAEVETKTAAEVERDKCVLQFTTDDTVHPEKLAQLAQSEALLDLFRNKHLRDFLKEVDSAPNAWKAMKYAMLEPLFVEFADECLKVVEEKPN